MIHQVLLWLCSPCGDMGALYSPNEKLQVVTLCIHIGQITITTRPQVSCCTRWFLCISVRVWYRNERAMPERLLTWASNAKWEKDSRWIATKLDLIAAAILTIITKLNGGPYNTMEQKEGRSLSISWGDHGIRKWISNIGEKSSWYNSRLTNSVWS